MYSAGLHGNREPFMLICADFNPHTQLNEIGEVKKIVLVSSLSETFVVSLRYIIVSSMHNHERSRIISYPRR